MKKKGYGFLTFAKEIGTHATKAGKNLSDRHSQKLLYSAKESTADALKTTSKRITQKTAEATGNFISNKIADKITKASKNNSKMDENELEIPKGKHISPEKRRQIID